MYCMKCCNDLSECTCDDINERLQSVSDMGNFVYKKCLKCNKHYSQCKCENPEWGMSQKAGDGECQHDIEWIDGGGVSGSYPRCKKCGKIIDKLFKQKAGEKCP